MKLIKKPSPEKDDPIFREGLRFSIPVPTEKESFQNEISDTAEADGKQADDEI